MESGDEPILSDIGLKAPVKSIGRAFLKRSSIFKFWSSLNAHRPGHLLIGGYGYIESWLALIYSIINKVPVTFWTGAGNETTISDSKFKLFLKKIFVKNIDTAITYGSNASAYLIKLGVDSKKIFNAINVSDTKYFKRILASYLDSKEMLSRVGSLSRPILIFSGRLEESKGVNLLIEQLKLIPPSNYFCYFIGKGSLSNNISECIRSKEINGELLGYLPQEEVAKCLVQADVYILPSLNDPFSRTLSEALASGCFVLNSKHDDASFDLIKQGKNGYIFDPNNFEEFKMYIEMVTDGKWKRPSRIKISNNFKYDMAGYANLISNSILESLERYKD